MPLTDSEEAKLRRALSIIGAEAVESEPPVEKAVPNRQGPPLWRRRGTLLAAASVSVAVIAGAVALNMASDEPASNTDASRTVTGAERIACSEQIFEGSIVSATDTGSKRTVRLEVRVTEWLKPADGPSVITFTAPSASAVVVRPYKPGQHVFVMVQDPPRIQANVSRGNVAQWERREFNGDLPEAKHTKCPAFWDNPDAGPDVPDDS